MYTVCPRNLSLKKVKKDYDNFRYVFADTVKNMMFYLKKYFLINKKTQSMSKNPVQLDRSIASGIHQLENTPDQEPNPTNFTNIT